MNDNRQTLLLEKMDDLRAMIESLLAEHPELGMREPELVEETLEAHDACLDAIEDGKPGELELEQLELSVSRLADARDRHLGPTCIASVNRTLAWVEQVQLQRLSAPLAASLIAGESDRLRSRGDQELLEVVGDLARALRKGDEPEPAVRALMSLAARPPKTGLTLLDDLLEAWATLDWPPAEVARIETAVGRLLDWTEGLGRALEPLKGTAPEELVEELWEVLQALDELAEASLDELRREGTFAWRLRAEEAAELALDFGVLAEELGKAVAASGGTVGLGIDVRDCSDPRCEAGFAYLRCLITEQLDGEGSAGPLLEEVERLRHILTRLIAKTGPHAASHGELGALGDLSEALDLLEQGTRQGIGELIWRGGHALEQAERQLESLQRMAQRQLEPDWQRRKIA